MHLIKHRKHLRSGVLLVCIATLIWFIADFFLEFSFPTYLQSLNKSYLQIGLLLSMASLSGMLVDMPIGSLSNLASRRRLMVSGLIILIISTIFIFFLKMDWFLVGIFLLWGIGFQLWKVPRDAQYASLTTEKNRAALYGLELDLRYIGQTVGPILGGLTLVYLGFKGIFSIFSILLIVIILTILVFMKETNHRSILKEVAHTAKWSNLIRDLKSIKALGIMGLALLFFSLLFTAWEQIIWTFGPLFYGPDILNVSPSLGGLLMACFYIPGIFLSYYFGKLADKVGKKNTLIMGVFLLGIAIISFSFAKSVVVVFLQTLLVSIGIVISLPALDGLIVDLSYKQKKGRIAGTWDFFMDMGYVIGPIFGGIIAEWLGLRAVFFSAGVLFIFAAIVFLFIKHHEHTPGELEQVGIEHLPK